jgi:peptide chain release factor subunit 1
MTEPAPKVLILTPIKDAVRHLDRYVEGLATLTYDRRALSLGVLEGDSDDASFERIVDLRPRLSELFSRVTIAKRDFGFKMKGAARWAPAYQLARRSILAKARNTLLMRALDDEDWVLWLDVDVASYPPDIVERLIAFDLDILHPHCVLLPGGPTFDRNAWAEKGSVRMEDRRGAGKPTRLTTVGGTMLLVRADRHRDGLIFPPFRYGLESDAIRDAHPVWGRGEVETEGFGILARDMGLQCWGLPDLEIIHASE